MKRLSTAATRLRSHYQVVVVGSGYGGAIAASRLARAGRQVCVLERGKEFQPGEYPDTALEAADECQLDTPERHIGARSGLYEFHVNKEINVFKGCGLGGTSLVNANVAIEAEERVFDDPRWPEPLRGKAATLAAGYERARGMLGSRPYPDGFPKLCKMEAFASCAERLGTSPTALHINVSFADGPNAAGVMQNACTLCGDCVSGCNYGAKNTVLMNYLPDAKNHGAELYTCIEVRHLERRGERWQVHYHVLDAGREVFDSPTQFVTADCVVLAGGTLGSTEILLRSRARGLALSSRLGRGFSGNGDVLGFAYNCDREINAVGWGAHEKDEVANPNVGPCITGGIDLRRRPRLDEGMIIEEGVIPGALREIAAPLLASASGLIGSDTDAGLLDEMREWARQTLSLVTPTRYGALRNTQVFLVMAHDDAGGVMELQDDRLRIRWPGVGMQPIFRRANEDLEKATAALGGTYVKSPVWTEALGHDLITVHPLGGCCMADSAEAGVVNHMGQVYSGDRGSEVYDSLLVCDGAIVPCSLGTNPLLTISALAERNIELLANAEGWTIDYASLPPQRAETVRPGVQFTETMKGYFAFGAADFQSGWTRGKDSNGYFQFILTVRSDDLEAMLSDPDHRAEMSGSVIAPSLSTDPISVAEGEFQLFRADPARVGATQMRYRMNLTTKEGRTLLFEGYKEVHDDPGFDPWSDTTTLYISLTETSRGGRLGKGILRIEPADFLRQIRTIRTTHAQGPVARLRTIARFGEFFAGALFRTYGGVFAPSSVHDPKAPPRKRRPLRIPPPVPIAVRTEDGLALRLTRHQAGKKGPVILAPGMGTSTLAFALDTIDVSLAEYLAAHGYDLWLFDYRASSDLPTSRSQFSLDEIGRYDYPAALAKVRELTGADSVQIVAHCVASAGLFMSLLGGHLQGLRSAICSQFMPHVECTPLPTAKAALRLPALLQAFGVEVLSTEFDSEAGFADQVYDALLRLYPAEAGQLCDSPVCRRIRFMWGETFLHENLNYATHRAIHELFGDGNLRLFQHLASIVRAGRLVNRAEQDVYLPEIRRLALPITLIQGAKNTLFLPSASQKTFEALIQANGAELYRRKVFDEYAHMDCFIGKDAAADVFPYLLSELERFN